MNDFNMTCQHCDQTFTITDANRTNWAKGACDTCLPKTTARQVSRQKVV